MPKGKKPQIDSLEEAARRILNMEKALSAVTERVAKIDPAAIRGAAKEAERTAAEVHQVMRVMILKLAVVTEVPRFLDHRRVPSSVYLPRLLALLERDDDWWRKRGEWTMGTWAQELAQVQS